jgi:hypothetical protein
MTLNLVIISAPFLCQHRTFAGHYQVLKASSTLDIEIAYLRVERYETLFSRIENVTYYHVLKAFSALNWSTERSHILKRDQSFILGLLF